MDDDPTQPVLPADEVAEPTKSDVMRLLRGDGPCPTCGAEVEALRAQLAAAHDVIRRLRNGWEPDIPCLGPEIMCWFKDDVDDPEPLTEAEVAVIQATTDDPASSDVDCGRSVGAFWCIRPAGHEGECNRAYPSGRAVLDAADATPTEAHDGE